MIQLFHIYFSIQCTADLNPLKKVQKQRCFFIKMQYQLLTQQIQQMQNQFMQVGAQSSSPTQLKLSIKQNEIMISILSKEIRKKQNEMKQFSEDMTKLIQKKLMVKNESQYSHPNFNPVYATPRLQQLHKQKQQIYAEIRELKNQISMIVSQEQPQVANEYHKKQSLLVCLQKDWQKGCKQKQLLQECLRKNKDMLEAYKSSQCLKEIEQNEQQLERIKKQIKELDKDMKIWSTEEIYISLFNDSVQQDIEWLQNQQEKEQEVDKQTIDGLVDDIHGLIEEKKMVDREFVAKRQEISRKIRDTIAENVMLQKEIRQIRNLQIQKQLQKKKKQILSRNKSLPQMMSSTPRKKPVSISPTLHLSKPKPVQEGQKRSGEDKIYIGVWKEENLIKDDIIQRRNISRAIGLKIRTKDKKLVGVGATYIDKVGVEVHGRSNIWKLSDDILESGEQQLYIDLQDVVSIYYNPTNANPEAPIGLKFLSKTSRPIIKIGETLNQQEQQFIDLENKFIKTLQFTLDNNYKSISGMRLTIGNVANESAFEKNKRPIKNQSIFESEGEGDEHNNTAGEDEDARQVNQGLMPSKWLSTTSQGRIMQSNGNKKVFLKNVNKKLNQMPQVDHRLMLNRKKKMV